MKFLTFCHYCIWVLFFNGLGVLRVKVGQNEVESVLVDSVVQHRRLSVYSLVLPSKQRSLGSSARVACADD